MEFQRCQPARASLGHARALPDGAGDAGRGRPGRSSSAPSASCWRTLRWWVNRKDRFGKNVFEGGFLGLDNIGVFDRSAPLPTGGHLEQADGTSWMAFFSQNMLELAIEIAARRPQLRRPRREVPGPRPLDQPRHKPRRRGRHVGRGGRLLLRRAAASRTGTRLRLKVRSMVGLLPLCATSIIEPWQRERVPRRDGAVRGAEPSHAGAADECLLRAGATPTAASWRWSSPTVCAASSRIMLDENEFLEPYGIRALSRYHLEHPYVFNADGSEYRVNYLPADSDSGMFGGNSNWRGPVWMPVNMLIIRALLSFYVFYGDSFKVECPTGSGREMNLFEVAQEIANRLISIFLRDGTGGGRCSAARRSSRRIPTGATTSSSHEYFHGDNGAGVGASHQTGWSGLVATLIQLFRSLDAAQILESGKNAAFAREWNMPRGTKKKNSK